MSNFLRTVAEFADALRSLVQFDFVFNLILNAY